MAEKQTPGIRTVTIPVPARRPVQGGFTSASVLNPSVEQIQQTLFEMPSPRPLQSLLASAAKITTKQTSDSGFRKFAAQQTEWQADGWAMYDLVGELRFVVDNLASRSSKAHFYVAELTDKADRPTASENEELQTLLSSIGAGSSGLARIIERLVANLKVPGEGWLAGIPSELMPFEEEDNLDEGKKINRGFAREPVDVSDVKMDVDLDLDNYTWRMFSTSEVTFETSGAAILELGPTDSEKLRVNPDDVYLIRVHKPHPERGWQADSATRASLPVLRELVGLTMHVSSQVDSRLAGAGVFIVPESYSRAVKRSMGLPDDSPEDPVTDALMQSMLTPISDRSTASANVPLVLTVPDEAADKFRHITFDKGLDNNALNLRTESIRRLALGMDCPPELLLGTGTMNHWGGWLMREDVIRAHIEPTLALVCDAVTTQFLRPVIKENFPDLNPDDYAVWYDVEHLILRADAGEKAIQLYNMDELSGDSLRRATGFDESDAPKQDDTDKLAIDAVFEMVKVNPGLMRRPGLDVLVRQVKALLDGSPLGSDDMVEQAAATEATAQSIEASAGVEVDSSGGDAAAGDVAPVDPAADPAALPVEGPAGVATTPGTAAGPPSMAVNIRDTSALPGLRGSLSGALHVDSDGTAQLASRQSKLAQLATGGIVDREREGV